MTILTNNIIGQAQIWRDRSEEVRYFGNKVLQASPSEDRFKEVYANVLSEFIMMNVALIEAGGDPYALAESVLKKMDEEISS